jgi:hypothetical protein
MTIPSQPVLGRMLRPLAQSLRSEVLEAFAALDSSSADEELYHTLADKNAEGTITEDERRELEGIVSANTVLSLLRREARETLARR